MSIENIQKTDAECGTIAGMDELQDAVTLAAELAPQTLTEAALEIEINDACQDLALAITHEQQRAAFALVQELHQRRTPEQIARMEYERGLCR